LHWGEGVWSRILAAYPFGVVREGAAAAASYEAAGQQLSQVRADWFVAVASRPPLYHDVLQLPDTEGKLQEQLHVSVAENIRQERVVRAGFNGSGVSRNNRLIERHDSPYGAYWRSYDFAGNRGRRNLFAHPLGPGSEESYFAPDGGEVIFSLPNQLYGFMLVDAEGRRLDRGPLAIVSDPRRPDRAVENGISCMGCHSAGLVEKDDQIRTHLQRNPGAFGPKEAEAIRAVYPPEATLRALLAKDNERFREAVRRTGGGVAGGVEPIPALALRYERDLDLAAAAAELGKTPAALAEELSQSAALARRLGSLRVAGGTVQRAAFNECFPELVRDLKLGVFVVPDTHAR
jgi:hypothetical protein